MGYIPRTCAICGDPVDPDERICDDCAKIQQLAAEADKPSAEETILAS